MNLNPPEFNISADNIDAILNCNIRDQGGMAVGRETPEAKLILERINLKRKQQGLDDLDLDKNQPVVFHRVEHKQLQTSMENVKFIESTATDMITGKTLDRVNRSLETRDTRYFKETDEKDILLMVEDVDTSNDVDVTDMPLTEVIALLKAGKIPNYIQVDVSRDDDFKLAAQELGLTDEVEVTAKEIVKIFDTGIRGGGQLTEVTSDGQALAGDRQKQMGVILELRQGVNNEGEIDMDQLGLTRYPIWHIEEMISGNHD